MSVVTIKIIPTRQLERRVKNDISVGEALVSYTNSINQQFFQRIEILSVNDARRKVIALLAFLVEKTGSKGVRSTLDISLTQQDIANMSGLTRESISKQLSKLKQEGLILNNNGSMIINVDKLNAQLNKLAIVI